MALSNFDVKFNDSALGKFFKMNQRGTTFMTEARAGVTTFVTMAYIIAVNAAIITDSGGGCVCPPDKGICAVPGLDAGFDACLFDVKKSLITATTIGSMIGTLLIGTLSNLPLGVAPGMGINAYFAYTVVGFHGTGMISYKDALGAIFLEGIIFSALAVFGLRQFLARMIPDSLKFSMGAGIGFFLAFIGIQSAEGIGLVTNDGATLVTLGGCDLSFKDASGTCTGGKMLGATTWAGIAGFALIGMLLMYRVKGAIMVGIVAISIISWIRTAGNKINYFTFDDAGEARFDFFKKVVDVPNISKTGGVLGFNYGNGQVWLALVTFLYVDIFDTTGCLYSMASFAGLTNDRGEFEGGDIAFIADGVAITIGSVLGISPVTAFVESAAGIAEGGKTGLTAFFVAVMFFISLFFAPIFASFPPWATGPALIIVGSMMLASGIAKINWLYYGDSIPAFVCIGLMPLTYSVAYGLIGGICTYVVLNGVAAFLKFATGGKIAPDETYREVPPWIKYKGTPLLPAWMRKAMGKPEVDVPVYEEKAILKKEEVDMEEVMFGKKKPVVAEEIVENGSPAVPK